MAIAATIYTLDIDLADSDRHVYETLALRVARHPSESGEYLVARVLAYAMEYAEGIEFSRGVSEPDEPAIVVRDLTGRIQSWIEIGSPDALRLHKAAKTAARVAVYTHKDPVQLLRNLTGEKIHRAADIELYAIDRRADSGPGPTARPSNGVRPLDQRARAVCVDWRGHPHRARHTSQNHVAD